MTYRNVDTAYKRGRQKLNSLEFQSAPRTSSQRNYLQVSVLLQIDRKLVLVPCQPMPNTRPRTILPYRPYKRRVTLALRIKSRHVILYLFIKPTCNITISPTQQNQSICRRSKHSLNRRNRWRLCQPQRAVPLRRPRTRYVNYQGDWEVILGNHRYIP